MSRMAFFIFPVFFFTSFVSVLLGPPHYALAQKKVALTRKETNTSKPSFELNKKVTSLLLQKQREQALQYIDDNKFTYADQPQTLLNLKEVVSTYFLSQEAQDAYEISATQLLQNTRLAEKNNQKCLALEKDNFFCLWQNLKILRLQNSNFFQTEADYFLKTFKDYPQYGIMALSLRSTFAGDNTAAGLSELVLKAPPNSTDFYTHLSQIFQYNRAISVKNYSEAKMILNLMSIQFPDYPDTLYMTAQLAELSAETSIANSSDLVNLYRKKCANLSGELTRKYFYDIDLCHRR